MSKKLEKVNSPEEKPQKNAGVDRVDNDPLWKGRELKELVEQEPNGEYLNQLPPGGTLEVVTQNHTYLVERYGDDYYISGHPQFCPALTKVRINGSVWPGGSILKMGFVGEDMQLEFILPDGQRITTSLVKKVTKKSSLPTVQ
jgi:hypothetical protein